MTKTCGQCGHPALDDQASFCNRCGAPVPEEKRPAYPICPSCGSVVSDDQALFCNRCGAKISPIPVLCSSCGSPAIDSQSRFCTRCGTTFDRVPPARTCRSCGTTCQDAQSAFCNRCGAPLALQEGPGIQGTARAALCRSPAPVSPAQDPDWEPWNDVPASAHPARPDPVIPVQSRAPEQQITMPRKRYAHLPLVAEEMKKPADTTIHLQAPEHLGVPKKRPTASKKGVLGLLKK